MSSHSTPNRLFAFTSMYICTDDHNIIHDFIRNVEQDDFQFSIKKSVIDFTLQDVCNYSSITAEKKSDLDEIQRKKQSFEITKMKIKRNLFKIHPTVVKINQLWSLQYR